MNYDLALAFKVQAEPGWRGVCANPGDPVEGEPELRYYTITVTAIGYWGLFLHSRKVSPLSGLAGLFGMSGLEFEALDSDGKAFDGLRRIVSPAETISGDELISEVMATLKKKT